MSQIDNKTLREAQLIMLNMLIEFDSICSEYNLNYWLDSGTLLGAIRHKGFIPWDDDIDISMPIEDYLKFLDIAPTKLSSNIFLQTQKSDKSFPFDYIKLRSNRAKIVEFHEDNIDIKYHQGVFVDIFPMITIPDEPFYKDFYDNIFALIRKVSPISLHTLNGRDLPQTRFHLQKSLKELHQGWEKSNLKVIYSPEMPDVSAWFDIDKIFPLSKIEFEGHNFSAPNSPHHYLENIYSFNYMELPPKDKRYTHAKSIEVI